MATPRIFVSSTCYDLQEIRYNLRDFIKNFGYEPVMSDFGDIFYEYDSHVQDSCVKEIEKCQMYILIIGNNYGSNYHRESRTKDIPDSVTLQEFRKSIDTKIPKHIFINRFVKYDYDNYRRALDKELSTYFEKNDISKEEIDKTKLSLKNNFDLKYPFPQKSYRYIFHFIDIIQELKINNAILTFETTIDIQEQLKKQWAGYMYERLTNKTNEINVSTTEIDRKISNIEKLINEIFSNSKHEDGNLLLDVDKISKDIENENLTKAQDILSECLKKIMYNIFGDDHSYTYKFFINEEVNINNVRTFLDSLSDTLKRYKWSKVIPVNEVFSIYNISLSYKYPGHSVSIDYANIMTLNKIYLEVPDSEKDLFINSILQEFKGIEKIEEELPF